MNRKISIIGLGYVGLPIAIAFSKYAHVIGFDINRQRIETLLAGRDHTGEIALNELKSSDIYFTFNPDELGKSDFYIVTVPTPVDKAKQPDLTFLLRACEILGKILKKGDIVVFESTVYPGCTEEDCVPILENTSGLKLGKDFGVGYSPERINPGDKEHTFTKTKKVVSASNFETEEIVAEVYSSVVVAGVHRASSIKVAEAAKVIENAQRDLNIAFVNELAMLFNCLDIEMSEVLEAAKTKWNFLSFQPGLVGGHCVGVDPYYLTHKAERIGFHTEMIKSGRRINDSMSVFVARKTIQNMTEMGIGSVGALITVIGLTFKENCPDLRNSQVPKIITELKLFGSMIQVHDPCCDSQSAEDNYGIQLCTETDLRRADAIIIAVPHLRFRQFTADSWKSLLKPGGVITDVKNIVPKQQMEDSGHRVWTL
jgi:UDP-N-acetyl-D-glucosamine/UDP-N-acetyl-D-galactosamine dehydrogenase